MGLESGIRKKTKTYPGSGSATLFVWDFIFGLDMKDLGLVTNLGFTSAYGFCKKPGSGSKGKLIWISNACFGLEAFWSLWDQDLTTNKFLSKS
jgi:hypothetical protein